MRKSGGDWAHVEGSPLGLCELEHTLRDHISPRLLPWPLLIALRLQRVGECRVGERHPHLAVASRVWSVGGASGAACRRRWREHVRDTHQMLRVVFGEGTVALDPDERIARAEAKDGGDAGRGTEHLERGLALGGADIVEEGRGRAGLDALAERDKHDVARGHKIVHLSRGRSRGGRGEMTQRLRGDRGDIKRALGMAALNGRSEWRSCGDQTEIERCRRPHPMVKVAGRARLPPCIEALEGLLCERTRQKQLEPTRSHQMQNQKP